MNGAFMMQVEQDVFILSFSAPVRVLSWAVLNGGFCYADHIINHRVRGSDCSFCDRPRRWLQRSATKLGLNGKVVAMATAVEMDNLSQASLSGSDAEVTCFATVGCGNALSAGDPASVMLERAARRSLHTINIITVVQPGLSEAAMVEAIQLATEGRVRALAEAGIRSSASSLIATGTGTDCIAIASLGTGRTNYCGKHTRLGEFIGLAVYTAVKKGLLKGMATKASPPLGNGNPAIPE